MSFFYLTPVKGDMPIHLLETIIFKRIEFLSAVIKDETIVFNEFVIEGSIYDNVGHFMLCITMILCDNIGFSQFCIKAEIELFKRRLRALSAYDMRSFAKKLLRSIKKYETVPTFIEPLEIICERLMLKKISHHLGTSGHEDSCSMYNIQLYFKHCLHFVSKRQVELTNGRAVIPCAKWRLYLTLLFHKNLQHKLNQVDLKSLRNDPRLAEIIKKIKNQNLIALNNNTNILKSKDVDGVSKLFPPCMMNLHSSLRRRHRLSHDQRFHYSLFLKDIGMPVDEAVDFWRLEYRQSPSGSHSCSHHWEKDEKKYLYGIRHMYGLEGARKNYTSVSCQRIQCNSNAGSEGGCPFKSFDHANMVKLLDPKVVQSQSFISQINMYKSKTQYSPACMLYLQECISGNNHICDKVSFNFTPVNYYKIACKANKL